MDTMDQDLTAVNVSSESVTVTWRSNGHDVNYEVTVTCEQSASSCNESLTNCPEPTRTFDTNGLNELTFPAKPFTEYKVKVTEIGHGGDTAMPFTVRAKEAVPILPVMNLNQTLVPQESSIDVALTWEKPCSQSAPFSHYEVKLKESRGITEERVFRSTYLHQRITNLKPETNYMATVNPVYIVGSHQSHGLSSMIGFTTPEATSLRGKCALGVERKSKETAMVKIQRCVFLDISDIERWMLIVSQENSHYSLGADKSGCKEKIWCNNVLQSDSDYFIMLRAVTSQGFVDSHVTHIRTVASANSKIILSIVLVLGFIIMCFIIFRFCREYVRNRRHGVAEITPVAHFKSSDPEKQVYIAISKPQDDDVMEKSPKVAHVSPEVKFQEDKEKLQSIDLGVIEEPTEGIRQTDGIDNQSFLKSDDDDVFESQKFTHPENKDQAQIPENNDDKSFLNGDDYDFQGQKVTEGQTKDIDDQPLMNEKGGDDFQGQTLSPPTVNDIENQIVVTEDAETLKDQESLVDDLQEENSPELLIQESENLGNILETAFE
ncbi:hypothetical protein B566_EDAN016940 [Ephemera danica]|nr:hypothetical protein B566_EDAN016940 [Ephemera danica]